MDKHTWKRVVQHLYKQLKSRPPGWIFWHPHQKLWNWSILGIIYLFFGDSQLAKFLDTQIIKLDTSLWNSKLNKISSRAERNGYNKNKTIRYFDLGTHKEAEELKWMHSFLSEFTNPIQIFGFEAHPDHYNEASINTGSLDYVEIYNFALVHQLPKTDTVRLYTGTGGLSDSIYRSYKKTYIDVPAMTFSQFLVHNNIDLSESINLIRMNIEGAEWDVIKDLIDKDLLQYFDGFFGMWDDLSKIDLQKDKEFRALLKEHKIHTFPFNGRDMKIQIRINLIRKSLLKAINL
jgi:FkbM family methyltransferase